MNQCIVYYEDWQMQCCGTPFKIGDAVGWLVLKSDSEDIPVDVGEINYYYEAHSSNYKALFMLSGVVAEIRALHIKFEISPDNPKLKIPVSGITVPVDSADGWDKPFQGVPLGAYIVKLNNASIRAADQSEVTFR